MKFIPRYHMIFYMILLMVIIPLLTIYFYDNDHASEVNSISPSIDTTLANRLIELSERLRHAEMLSSDRKRDINALRNQMNALTRVLAHNDLSILNSTKFGRKSSQESSLMLSDMLQLPSIYHFLPYLLASPDSLQPAYRLSRSTRTSATMVLGVPTVKRTVESYLISTLHNLIDNLSLDERNEAVIVVFIAEIDMDYVKKTASEIHSQFSEHIDSGLIEIIAPPESYYPNFNDTRQTLGDPIERVRWRMKQNLDFAYLMMYSQPKGTYYVQLEDDILSKPNYLTKMKAFAIKSSMQRKDWLILDFCNLGFIGKMFKSVDLSMVIIFFVMFHNDKPVDWLLEHLIQTKLCRFDKDFKECKKQKELVWIHHKPSLFQHIGTHSSLKGKLQKLRDRGFGKLSLYYPHKDNPYAETYTNMQSYKGHSIERAYTGEDYFWGMSPKSGDVITFSFNPEVNLERYYIRTGNPEHPEDKLIDATIEISPLSAITKPPPYLNRTDDGYYVIGGFKLTKGIADGFVPHILCPVKELRIRVHSDSDRWAIISEIYLKSSVTTLQAGQ